MTTVQMSVTRNCHIAGCSCETDEHEYEVTITGDVTPFRPGRYTGPLEFCFPDEGGEVEITSVTCDGDEFELTDEEQHEAEDLLRQAAEEEQHDADE